MGQRKTFYDETEGREVRWRGNHARKKFRAAFSEGFAMPPGIDDLQLASGNHATEPLAIAYLVGGERLELQVLDCDASARGFRRDYPDSTLILIVVNPEDSHEAVRQQAFRELRRCGVR